MPSENIRPCVWLLHIMQAQWAVFFLVLSMWANTCFLLYFLLSVTLSESIFTPLYDFWAFVICSSLFRHLCLLLPSLFGATYNLLVLSACTCEEAWVTLLSSAASPCSPRVHRGFFLFLSGRWSLTCERLVLPSQLETSPCLLMSYLASGFPLLLASLLTSKLLREATALSVLLLPPSLFPNLMPSDSTGKVRSSCQIED